MKIAAVSTAAQQLVLNNVSPVCGFKYFDDIDYIGVALYNPDVIYFGGWYVDGYVNLEAHRTLIGDAKRVIIHWYGSDVLACKIWNINGERAAFEQLKSDRFCHIPASEKIRGELVDWFGFETTDPLNTPAQKLRTPIPKPERFAVGCYMPPDRQRFYRVDEISAAMEIVKKADLIFYHWLPPTTDINFMGPCDKRYALAPEEYDRVIQDSSCLLRIPEHDAISISAAEFLMSGRPVISDQELPHWPARIRGKINPRKIASAINETKRDGSVSDSVVHFYQEMFDPSLFKKRLEDRCRQKWSDFSFEERT